MYGTKDKIPINDGKNRSHRCNRELSDPYARYGWWCANLLGVDAKFRSDAALFDSVAQKMKLTSTGEERILTYPVPLANNPTSSRRKMSEDVLIGDREQNSRYANESTFDPPRVLDRPGLSKTVNSLVNIS